MSRVGDLMVSGTVYFIEFPMWGMRSSADYEVPDGAGSIYLGMQITKSDGEIAKEEIPPTEQIDLLFLKAASSNYAGNIIDITILSERARKSAYL